MTDHERTTRSERPDSVNVAPGFKGTPGPWSFATRVYGPGCVEADIIGPDKEDIGFVNASDGADEPTFYNAEANARLIAAAPDLLEALQDCAAIVAAAAPDHDLAIKRARAAIAKALGADR